MAIGEPTRLERMRERYRAGGPAWDDLPPPEVIAAAEGLAPGRLLDLGCGTARACIYLAERGWEADGVDLVPDAIAIARDRAAAAGVLGRVRLHLGSVADLGFLDRPYDLALDVGCLHWLEPGEQRRYAAELARLLRPGATCLIFAQLRDGDRAGPHASMPEGAVEALLGGAFDLRSVARGRTRVGELQLDSAWYTLARRAAP